MIAPRIKGALARLYLIIPISAYGVSGASLEQLVCGGSDVVVAEVMRGHAVESGYGKNCNLSVPMNDSCKMVRLAIRIEEILGEPADIGSRNLDAFKAGHILEVIAYAGELLPAGLTGEGLGSEPGGKRQLSDAELVRLVAGKRFIFSFDRENSYPSKSGLFYSAVFELDLKTSIQQILSSRDPAYPCPRPPTTGASSQQ